MSVLNVRRTQMKKLSSVGCVLFLVAWWAVLAPAKSSAPKDKWEKGWVSDSKCGAKGAGCWP